MECDCGITEFCSSTTGFDCILKQRFLSASSNQTPELDFFRYQDFLVNEIDLTGNEVRLTSLTAPEADFECVRECSWPDELSPDDIEDLTALNSNESGEDEPVVSIDCTKLDKDARTRIHKSIRAHFGGKLDSKSEKSADKYWIKVHRLKDEQTKHGRKRNYWPDERGGDYCHFTLYKENKDTVNAVAVIARFLGMKPKDFQFAGTKDKRAVTCQRMSVYRVHAWRLAELNRKLIGIRLGNFCYEKEEIRLGDLSGNRFTVVLRALSEDEITVGKKVESWKNGMFLNYFGTQRFGTTEIATWKVGVALLKEKWKEAVDLILCARDGGDKELETCHEIWSETGDPVKALAALPGSKKHTCLEGMILRQLSRTPNNFFTAVKALPRNSGNLYLHSYQSLVWNKILSRRSKQFGEKVVSGDLIADLTTGGVKTVKEEEIGDVSLGDIRLPLPGSDVVFPENEVKDWYVECLEEDGLSLEFFKARTKDFSLQGTYRSAYESPQFVKHEFMRYDDMTVPLARTDLDLLTETEFDPKQEGSLLALKLDFTLPTSVYATVALRELTKTDLGKKNQMTLSA